MTKIHILLTYFVVVDSMEYSRVASPEERVISTY